MIKQTEVWDLYVCGVLSFPCSSCMCCVGFRCIHVVIYSSHACELSTTITCPESSIDISITENNVLEVGTIMGWVENTWAA
jgi:hypothetical protein